MLNKRKKKIGKKEKKKYEKILNELLKEFKDYKSKKKVKDFIYEHDFKLKQVDKKKNKKEQIDFLSFLKSKGFRIDLIDEELKEFLYSDKSDKLIDANSFGIDFEDEVRKYFESNGKYDFLKEYHEKK